MRVWQWLAGIPEVVERWNKQGGALYLALTSLAAWLVLASTETGLRPSEVLARVADLLGVVPLARWLTADAPPALTGSSEVVRSAAMTVVALVAIVLAVRVLARAGRSGMTTEAAVVMSSRSVATPWLLLVVAAQQEPFHELVRRAAPLLLSAGAICVSAAAACWLVLRMLAHRLEARPLAEAAGRFAEQLPRGAAALLVLPGGMVLSWLGPILIVARWAFPMEPDRLRAAERERAEREAVPTGAASPVLLASHGATQR